MFFPRSRDCFFITLCFFLAALFSSCASSTIQKNSSIPAKSDSVSSTVSAVDLIFAGDIMAHEINYSAKNFERIWTDISPFLKTADFCFANLEAPVNDKKEWSTFPQFNMHSDYVEQAVRAGINVFSLANNHTNDWYKEGILSTKAYFSSKPEVHSCGIKSAPKEKLSGVILEKNGIKILFAAVTEILNRREDSEWIEYYPKSEKNRLFSELKELSKNKEHDLFVLGIHTDEEEYNTAVSKKQKDFYLKLISECGVDIIWANHPHCPKIFETVSVVQKNSSSAKTAFIMYANGNTISGQRQNPSFYKEPNKRDGTGDGLLIKMKIKKTQMTVTDSDTGKKTVKNRVEFDSIVPRLITSYIEPTKQITIKFAEEDFVSALKRTGLYEWADYLQTRIKLFEQLKGKSKKNVYQL